MEKIKISRAILVEGKYDKILLERFVDAKIFTTGGFSVFNAAEKCSLLKRIAETQGLIVLTDSDPAGFVIRNKLKGLLPKEKIIHIYAPAFEGKEKRKNQPSKAGILGIEGTSPEILIQLFEKAGVIDDGKGSTSKESDGRKVYTKADLYEAGLCGGQDSAAKRDRFCADNGLPSGMTPGALLEAVNILGIEL